MDQSAPNVDEEANIAGTKRKHFPTSFIDSIINGTTDESSMAPKPKIRCLDTSIPECRENNDVSRRVEPKSSVKRMQDMNSDHNLSKIPPTERKKWPQKACVQC